MSSVTEYPYMHKRKDTGYMESESSASSSQLIDALPVSGVRSKVGRIEHDQSYIPLGCLLIHSRFTYLA